MSSEDKLNDFSQINLPIKEYFEKVTGRKYDFPKYTTQLINIANQNSQGTRPKIVGQMSELIKECPDKSFDGWKRWYLQEYPDAIDRATRKIKPMIENMNEAMQKISNEMIRSWVEDLILVKTAEGLVIQEIILRYIADKKRVQWRLAKPYEESKGIDGYIGEIPIQIKAYTYLSKKSSVREKINVNVVYYKKTDKYLKIYTNLV